MKPNSRSLPRYLVSLELALLAMASLSLEAQKHALGAQKHEANIRERLDASAAVLGQLITAPDRPIPKQVLPEARCIVVVPSLVSYALGIGVRRGKGVATCRVTKDWSAPAPVAFTGGSVGFQMGGEKIDLILIGMNQSAIERLLSRKLKAGKNISVVAGPVASEPATDIQWRSADILSYSRSHGHFVGINLKGSALKQDKDATVTLYGRYIPFVSILEGKVHPPAVSVAFLATVRKYMGDASPNPQGK
jgi:lipid-binding SYLF domain-containing protein